jgi:hypothetical protein
MFFFLFLKVYVKTESAITNWMKMVEREKHEGRDQLDRDEIYSKVIRAGKRTYFFDVKATRGEDYYLTITESKKIFDMEGNSHYEKHKIFLYKEDFEKFAMGFDDAISFISTLRANMEAHREAEPGGREDFNSVDFEDLGE